MNEDSAQVLHRETRNLSWTANTHSRDNSTKNMASCLPLSRIKTMDQLVWQRNFRAGAHQADTEKVAVMTRDQTTEEKLLL